MKDGNKIPIFCQINETINVIQKDNILTKNHYYLCFYIRDKKQRDLYEGTHDWSIISNDGVLSHCANHTFLKYFNQEG